MLADCCNPIPGDTVVGFQVSDNRIVVHQTSCPNAISQMSRFGNRIIKTKWRKGQNIAFLLAVAMLGIPFYGHGWRAVIIGVVVLAILWYVLSYQRKP